VVGVSARGKEVPVKCRCNIDVVTRGYKPIDPPILVDSTVCRKGNSVTSVDCALELQDNERVRISAESIVESSQRVMPPCLLRRQ
jgi:hypothetical protein